MIKQEELQAATLEAAELAKRLKNSPLKTEWEPRINKACARIDEAYSLFNERVQELSVILQEVKRLLND